MPLDCVIPWSLPPADTVTEPPVEFIDFTPPFIKCLMSLLITRLHSVSRTDTYLNTAVDPGLQTNPVFNFHLSYFLTLVTESPFFIFDQIFCRLKKIL